MVFESAGIRLKSVRTVLVNESCEILVCENLNDTNRAYSTVIIVKEHELVGRFLKAYENSGGKNGRVETYASGGRYLIVYPYERERPLKTFCVGGAMSLQECEEICINLIIACMTCELPWPILYLVLTQDQVHLAADGGVYLSYMIDMSSLDETKTQKDCVVACARILLRVLESKAERKADSYVLLNMKTERESYETFPELYKDVEVASVSNRNNGLLVRIIGLFTDHKDQIFRVFLMICVLLLVFTVVTLLTNAIFGDVPWLRFFVSSFEQIGKESMLQ